MRYYVLLAFLYLTIAPAIAQNNKYWVRFKDKSNNTYSLSNPAQFLSQASIDRRTRQNIPLNETDLPVSESYIQGISPYISYLQHRLKWTNTVVVDMSGALSFRTDTTAAARDTLVVADSFSAVIYDTVVIHKNALLSNNSYIFSYDTARSRKIVRDTVSPPFGKVYVRDTIWLNDVITRNNIDSIMALPFVDTIALIQYDMHRSAMATRKFEQVQPQVNQAISYPSKYGAAYHQINMVNADLLHQMGFTGQGIAISVMDNGFSQADHIAAYDSVRPRILATWDFVNNEPNVYNDGSHGENTFSCMAANLPNKFIGTAPGADYYLFTTEDDGAEWIMEEYNWAAAAEVADSLGSQLFSTSLGYTEFDGGLGSHTYADLTGNKTVITRAANTAFSKGILVLNSAGNEGQKTWRYIAAPADGDSVLAIGGVDSTRKLSGFSSRGPNAVGRVKPDICAQASSSAVITTGGTPGYSNGTSFSCPIMAGCAASLWSAFPDKSAREIYDAIVVSADRFWTPDSSYGYGIPNFYNAYLFLKTNYNGKILRVTDNAVVFPNPFTNELNVSLFNTEMKEHKLELFDMQGRKVYGNDFMIRDKTFEIIKIDAGLLQQGVYTLRLDGNDGMIKQLIKVK